MDQGATLQAPVQSPPPVSGVRGWRRYVPHLSRRQWRVFGIVSTAGFFENYDRALLSLALIQIQAGLRLGEAQVGRMLSLIRLGYAGALLISPLGDMVGRRRLLLWTIWAYTLATAISAVAPTAESFTAAQMVARAFAAAEASLSVVVLVEEVDAAVRGWSIGLMGALAMCGFGMAAAVFAMIAIVPFGWRGLYGLALAPLALIIPLRRLLPESRRFEELGSIPPPADTYWRRLRSWAEPILVLAHSHTPRLSSLLAVTFLVGLGGAPAFAFAFKYLQQARGWSPGQVSTMVIVGGALGIMGNVVAGRLSDLLGRRTIAAASSAIEVGLMWLFYHSQGALMVGAWVIEIFCDTAATTMLSAYAAELFPTHCRAAAGGTQTLAATLGAALGLLLESVLYQRLGNHWAAVSWLGVFWLGAPITLALSFPETAGRELEDISPHLGTAGVCGDKAGKAALGSTIE